jgi:hypothetical protein
MSALSVSDTLHVILIIMGMIEILLGIVEIIQGNRHAALCNRHINEVKIAIQRINEFHKLVLEVQESLRLRNKERKFVNAFPGRRIVETFPTRQMLTSVNISALA